MDNKQASDSELKVLNILLASEKSLSVRQISEILEKNDDIHWAHKTIATFLNRMAEKGFVDYDKKGITYYYYPMVEQKDFEKKEAKRFLKNYFKGSLKGFLSAFGEDELSALELKEIKEWAEHLDDK